MSLCGEVIYRGLKYGLYDSIYDWKEEGLPDVHIVGDFFLNFLIGWFVSSVAGAIAMPFDTVRKILMTDTKSTSPKVNNLTKKLLRSTLKKSIQTPQSILYGPYSVLMLH